jgi:GT2 family glycosyltransferase
MPDGPLISFVIPVRNDARHLRGCLASIVADVPPGVSYEMFVADNGSTDDSADTARAAGARVLPLPGLSVAELRNRAAREASGRYLAFVDADHEISPGWTRCAIETLDMPGIAGAGAPYHPPSRGTWVQRMYDAFRDHGHDVTDVEWLGSGNLAVVRETFLAVGGFDTGLVTCEDVDLCQRLRAGGGRLVCAPRMRSTHHGDPATLKALFFGELWRGKDNLRTSFRTPPSWRGLPSIIIPVADLLFVGVAALGVATAMYGGGWLAAGAAVGIMALAALRATVMIRRLRTASPLEAVRAIVVALTYDLARALAPVWSGPHAARRRAEARGGV